MAKLTWFGSLASSARRHLEAPSARCFVTIPVKINYPSSEDGRIVIVKLTPQEARTLAMQLTHEAAEVLTEKLELYRSTLDERPE